MAVKRKLNLLFRWSRTTEQCNLFCSIRPSTLSRNGSKKTASKEMADFSVITLGSSFSCAAIKPDNFTPGALCRFGFYVGDAQREQPPDG